MADDLSLLAAFIAGLLSFLSPCVLPVISSYLIFIGGTALDKTPNPPDPKKWFSPYQGLLLRGTAFFILGFSAVFILLSILFSSVFLLIGGANTLINGIAGGLVIILGLNMLFDFIPFLNYEKRLQPAKRPRNFLDSFMVGAAFGAGWTPCIGPILGSILLLAGQQGKLIISVGYLLCYSIGLGLPFLLAAFFFGSFLKYLEKLKPWRRGIHILSGIFIIGIGVFILFGRFREFNALLLRTGYALAEGAETPLMRFIPGLIFLGIALILLIYRTFLRKTKFFSWRLLIFCGVFICLSIAQISGLINCAAILAQWFMFMGV